MSEPGRMTTERRADLTTPPHPPQKKKDELGGLKDRGMRVGILQPMSSQLSWRVAERRDGAALIWSHSTSLPLFGLLVPPRSKCASRSSMFRGKKEEGGVGGVVEGGKNNVGTLSGVLAGGEGRGSPTVLSADALCMRSGSATHARTHARTVRVPAAQAQF